MSKKILIILCHPAQKRQSFCEALALAYQEGVKQAGHEVHFIKIADLKFDPILHEGALSNQVLEPDLVHAQQKIKWAEHIVLVYPLWNHLVPALFKGFIERVFTKDFAYTFANNNPFPVKLLKGRTAHLIQTMGMPTFLYRWFYGAYVTKALKNTLDSCGIKTVQTTFFGRIDNLSDLQRKKMLKKLKIIGLKT